MMSRSRLGPEWKEAPAVMFWKIAHSAFKKARLQRDTPHEPPQPTSIRPPRLLVEAGTRPDPSYLPMLEKQRRGRREAALEALAPAIDGATISGGACVNITVVHPANFSRQERVA